MSRVDEMFVQFNKKMKYEFGRSGVGWEKLERIPFSSPRLNYLTYGGVTEGIVEFSGPEGAGKTCAALDLIGNVQKLHPERDVVFMDIEGTYDARWAAKLGVNSDTIKYIMPKEEYAEELFQIIIDLLSDSETDISMIVVDSIAAMVSKQQYEGDMDKSTYGGISRPLTLFCNKVGPLLRKKHCCLILINQVREDMNSMYGGTTTPGGRGLKHSCSLRLEFRRSDYFDERGSVVSTQAENPAGHHVKVLLKKTKICRPDRKVGFFSLRYLTGIDYISDLIDVGVKLGSFRQGGAWFYAPDENGEEMKFNGKPKFYAYLSENPNMVKFYQDHINAEITAEDDLEAAMYIQQTLESGISLE